jgi:hypothetical protein
MWCNFGGSFDGNYMLYKTNLNRYDYKILNNLFYNKFNYKELIRILNIKRPFKLIKNDLGISVKTIDCDYPEFIIIKNNLNIYRFVMRKHYDIYSFYKCYHYLKRFVEFDSNFIYNYI